MIQILGIKRIMVLVVLVALCAALAAGVYMYLVPENKRLSGQLAGVRAEIANKRAEADRLRNEFEQIQQQKSYFESLQAAAFISDQNRLVARRRIIDIQRYTSVLSAGYNVSSADVVTNDIAAQIGHVVLSSPISVDIEAHDDLDVYNFIYWMENAFPGHVMLNNLTLERDLDLTEATLRAIGSGQSTPLMKGRLDFVWRTMAPESEIKVQSEFGSEGF